MSGDLSSRPHIDQLELAAQIKQTEKSECTMDSKSCEVLGSTQKQQSEEHQESTLKESNMKEEEPSLNHVKNKNFANPDNCFLGSSLYYGGPDEDYATSQAIKAHQNEIKMEYKQLEEAMDPFNLEYTVRGNWWNGSLYY